MRFALLIPIYQPSELVLPFLKSFSKDDFDEFICVNDGSEEQYDDIWKKVEEETLFKVLSYKGNKGKGFALKTGFRYIKENLDVDYVITADGDGQHCYEDIIRIREAAQEHEGDLVIGVRDFTNIPKKSKSGNVWSARYFKLATGKKLTDVQTGLRAIHKDMFEACLYSVGSRYEYEMNFLMEIARNFPIIELPIQTIYLNNNADSHFRPVADSLRFLITPILYLFVSVSAWGIDCAVFAILEHTAFIGPGLFELLYMVLIARSFSAPYQFFLLRYLVFHTRGKLRENAFKYFILAFVSAFGSWGLIWFFNYYLKGIGLGMLVYVKMLVDFILGVIKYFINLAIIFANKHFHRKNVSKE